MIRILATIACAVAGLIGDAAHRVAHWAGLNPVVMDWRGGRSVLRCTVCGSTRLFPD